MINPEMVNVLQCGEKLKYYVCVIFCAALQKTSLMCQSSKSWFTYLFTW